MALCIYLLIKLTTYTVQRSISSGCLSLIGCILCTLVLQSLIVRKSELSIALTISSGFVVKFFILLQFKNVSTPMPISKCYLQLKV